MRKIYPFLALLLLVGAPSFAHAAPTGWDFASGILQPLLSQVSALVKADHFQATSSTASIFPYASTTALSVSNLTSGNCVQATTGGLLTAATAPCSSGGGTVSTSSAETANQLPFWTSTNGTPALLSGGVSGLTFSSSANRLTAIYASSTALSATTICLTGDSCKTAWPTGATIGSGTIGQFPYYAAAGTTLTATSSLFLATSGNIGISTVSPSYRLDVAGYINTDQYSGYKQAGNTVFYATTTSNSLYIGQSAGASFLTSVSGASTMGNIAIGFQALNSATSSTQNTAVGYQAELGNTVSGDGIAVQNTAVGYQALRNITLGAANVAIGDAALFSNTTGSQNTAFGHQTLQANINGIRNMGIGYQALNANVSGGRNTAVGYQSGAGSTGSDNTFIGYSSGQSLTSGSGNIFIGQGVDAPVVSGSKQLNIGNVIYGTNIYDVSNVLSSTPVNGQVGIGTTTPYATLSVMVGGDYASHAASAVFAVGSSTAGTSTSTLFAILSNGNVGVGTTSPSSLLSIGNTNGINFSTGTSTFSTTGGIDLRGGGCFAVLGVCLGGSSGTVGSGTAGQFPYYAAAGTTLSATSSIFIASGGQIGIGTTTPGAQLAISYAVSAVASTSIWAGGTNTTITVPAGVSRIVVQMWGAGGGGGAKAAGSGAGGAGAYVTQTITGPAATYAVIVGKGGGNGSSSAGGTGFQSGGNGTTNGGGGGGSSGFGSIIACGGGGGSTGATSNGGTAGTTSGGTGGTGNVGNGGGGGCGTAGSGTTGGTGGSAITGTAGNGGASTSGGGGGSSAGQTGNGNNGSSVNPWTGGSGSGGAAPSANGALGDSGGGGTGSTDGNGGTPGAGGAGNNGGTGGTGGDGLVYVVFYNDPPSNNAFIVGTTSVMYFQIDSLAQNFIRNVINSVTYLFQEIDRYGHLITGGPAPTCGTGCTAVTGDDRTMHVTTGSSVSSATVNFANSYTRTPVCIATEGSAGTVALGASTTPTTVVLTFASALTTKDIDVMCQISTNFSF